MSLGTMKELPHMIKPVTLFLVILQMVFLFIPHLQGFGWFVILTTILMLIITVLVFAIFAVGFSPVVDSPHWWLAEALYAAIFCVCSAINVFYFLVNIFKNFSFYHILGTGSSVLLCLVWAFDAFWWFRNRTTSSSSSHSTNQATATPAPYPSFPAGANPA